MQKTVKKTAYIPGELMDIIERRITQLNYNGISEYILSLVLFDLYCKRSHWLTSKLLREPQRVIDEALLEIIKEFDNPNSTAGGWFEARMRELVEMREREKQAAQEGRPQESDSIVEKMKKRRKGAASEKA